ncbi:hypothetical protein D3C79_927890 [compost metagenome]
MNKVFFAAVDDEDIALLAHFNIGQISQRRQIKIERHHSIPPFKHSRNSDRRHFIYCLKSRRDYDALAVLEGVHIGILLARVVPVRQLSF